MNPRIIYKILIPCGIALVVLGNICRVMHWPYGALLLVLGYAIVTLVYPKTILSKKNKTNTDIIKGLAVFIWGGFGISYYVFFDHHNFLINAISTTGLALWAGASIYSHFFSETKSTDLKTQLLNICYLVSLSIVVIGTFFKMMHWPGGKFLLLLGVIVTAISFFFSNFIEDEQESE